MPAPVTFGHLGRLSGLNAPSPCVQLARVPGGQQRSLTSTQTGWSGDLSGRIVQLPKLILHDERGSHLHSAQWWPCR